jgi:hypothetical protein
MKRYHAVNRDQNTSCMAMPPIHRNSTFRNETVCSGVAVQVNELESQVVLYQSSLRAELESFHLSTCRNANKKENLTIWTRQLADKLAIHWKMMRDNGSEPSLRKGPGGVWQTRVKLKRCEGHHPFAVSVDKGCTLPNETPICWARIDMAGLCDTIQHLSQRRRRAEGVCL